MKQARYRNCKYLDWIKQQTCVKCMQPADDPHHGIGIGLSGMALTAPDWAVIPLCRRCHTQMHIDPTMQKEQWRWMALTLGKAIESGIL